MRKEFQLILLIQTSLLLLIFNCTGVNMATKLGIGANTNPTPEYSNSFYLLDKLGLVYHGNTISGQISNTAESKVSGQACSKSVLFLFAWGDSSIEAAKSSASITKVAFVEYEQMAILGALYHRFCTKVSGSTDAISSDSIIKTGK